MRTQEEYVVPGLGVVLLLAAIGFATGYGAVWLWALLGLLALGTIGTYFVPSGVQIELRAGIAALGLLALVIATGSLSFWLALLSLGTIGALQVRHAGALRQGPRHTIEWVKALRGQAEAGAGQASAPAPAADASSAPAATEAADASPAPAAAAASPASGLQQRLRLNLAGIGSSVLGLFAAVSVFLPWVTVMLVHEASNEAEESFQFALGGAGEQLEASLPMLLLVVLLAAGVGGMASVVLPRAAVIIIALVGLVITFFSYIYLFNAFAEEFAELVVFGVATITAPNIGLLLAGLCYLVIVVLQVCEGRRRSA